MPYRCHGCRLTTWHGQDPADPRRSTLDAEHIAADYAAGVLTLTIPVHEAAKPRSIEVTSSDQKRAVTA